MVLFFFSTFTQFTSIPSFFCLSVPLVSACAPPPLQRETKHQRTAQPLSTTSARGQARPPHASVLSPVSLEQRRTRFISTGCFTEVPSSPRGVFTGSSFHPVFNHRENCLLTTPRDRYPPLKWKWAQTGRRLFRGPSDGCCE